MIVVTSDHGGGGKSYTNHGAYNRKDRRILLTIAGDGIRAGHIDADCEANVSHVDVYPTVFDYLRHPIEDQWGLDGQSRLKW